MTAKSKRSACIVGAGGGIGRATTALLAAQGYGPLICLDLAGSDVDAVAAEHGATLEASELLASLSHQRRHAALVREIADTSSQLAALVRQRQATAMADPLDVSLVLADAARDQGTLAASRSRLAFIEGQLQTLMGLAPDSYVIQVPELQHDRLHEGATQLLQDAADTSPAWALARLDLERAEWSAREAARSRIPEPSIGPALLGDPEQPSLGLALGIPIPVLAPGQAAYRATLAERDAAHQRLIAAGREASREVHALLAHLTALEHTLDALGGPTLVSARRTADMARDRYRAGQIDILLMLSAQRAWSELETDHLDALLDIRLTQLALERAVGRPLQLQPPLTETP